MRGLEVQINNLDPMIDNWNSGWSPCDEDTITVHRPGFDLWRFEKVSIEDH